jgi:hypothetical protein
VFAAELRYFFNEPNGVDANPADEFDANPAQDQGSPLECSQ